MKGGIHAGEIESMIASSSNVGVRRSHDVERERSSLHSEMLRGCVRQKRCWQSEGMYPANEEMKQKEIDLSVRCLKIIYD